MDIKPFLHEHHLLYDKYEKQEACCDKCNQQIDGWAFTCESCRFWLHKLCAVQQLPSQTSHPLHSQHLLTLVYEDSLDPHHFFCHGCFSLTRNCLYQCRGCKFNLDLICASSTTITSHRYKEIQHFSHGHPLTQFNYRKVKKNHCSCFWCEKLLSGMSYGCFRCIGLEFFIHESCFINMPTTISKHHFHPSHPLQLKTLYEYFPYYSKCNACSFNISYCDNAYTCQKCKFHLHVHCAKFKPSLKHELHQHHLTLFPIEPEFRTSNQCKKCNEKIDLNQDYIFNDFYRCVQCDFNFHFHCLIPFSIKHEYHRHELILIDLFVEDYSDEYYCDICEEERKPNHHVYYCKECIYVAHIGCALNKIKDDSEFDHGSTSSMVDSEASIKKLMEQDETLEYFYHEHPLCNEVIGKNESAICQVCWLEISDQVFACKSCKYYLHKRCTKLPFEVLHPLHPQHFLKLISVDRDFDNPFTCEECRDTHFGFAYVCYGCEFKLDVKCATSWVPKTDAQRLKGMERQFKLCPFNPNHKLDFVNFGSNLRSYDDCSFCELKLVGQTYICFDCEYKLHESCLGFPGKMQLQFHPLHPFHPFPDYEEICSVCKSSTYMCISYSCLQCDLYLHPHCAKSLKRAVKSKSHIHSLYYFGSNTGSSYHRDKKVCGECQEKFSKIPFCFCMECDIKFHTECALPRSVKSKYHIHPFTLKDPFLEDDSGEYYCDICEEERYPEDHVYHCTKCQGLFFAHISCVLNSEEETAAADDPSSNLVLDFEDTSSLPEGD